VTKDIPRLRTRGRVPRGLEGLVGVWTCLLEVHEINKITLKLYIIFFLKKKKIFSDNHINTIHSNRVPCQTSLSSDTALSHFYTTKLARYTFSENTS
jgi:hypothetical protein